MWALAPVMVTLVVGGDGMVSAVADSDDGRECRCEGGRTTELDSSDRIRRGCGWRNVYVREQGRCCKAVVAMFATTVGRLERTTVPFHEGDRG